jgi:hypothetical protein
MRQRLAFVFGVILFACPSFAQLDRGMLTGSVVDSSSAGVPAAPITLRNVANNSGYKGATTGTGQFTIANLPVGTYELTVQAPGFKAFRRSGIDIRAAEVARVDVTMEIGAISESVVVTAEVSRVQTDSPQVGTSLTSQSIADLPLSFSGSRSPETFAYKLTPGVVGDSWASHINGSTTASKDVLLDGASVSTYRGGHFGESAVSVEAVQEFKVQTSGMGSSTSS